MTPGESVIKAVHAQRCRFEMAHVSRPEFVVMSDVAYRFLCAHTAEFYNFVFPGHPNAVLGLKIVVVPGTSGIKVLGSPQSEAGLAS